MVVWLSSLPIRYFHDSWFQVDHSSSMQLFTDTSGSNCWGACWSNHWLESERSPEQTQQDIVWKELYAIASAVNRLATTGLGAKILCNSLWQQHCGRHLEEGSTHCKEIMALICLLYFCAVHFNVHIMITRMFQNWVNDTGKLNRAYLSLKGNHVSM